MKVKKSKEKTTNMGKPRMVSFIKMQVIPDLKVETINDRVTTNTSDKDTLVTDDSTSYTGFENLVEKHQPQVITKEKIGEV